MLDVNVLLAFAWPNHLHHREAAFTPGAVSPLQAVDLLTRIAALPGHDFWADDPVVDLYLLRLRARHGGIFATLDRGAAALANREAISAVLVA